MAVRIVWIAQPSDNIIFISLSIRVMIFQTEQFTQSFPW